MVKKIHYTLVFNRLNRLDRNGQGLIQIRAYQSGRNRYFSTGAKVEPRFWDEKNKKVRSSHPYQFVLNKQIRDLLEQIEAFEIKMINRYGFFPLDRLHEYTDPKKDIKTFTDFFEEKIEDFKAEYSKIKADSLKNQITTFNKLKSFRKIVYFEDLNFQFIEAFDQFVRRDFMERNGRSIKPSTLIKHHKNLRKYIGLAVKDKKIRVEDDPYMVFDWGKLNDPNRVYLTELEVDAIERLQYGPDDYDGVVRDFFLLCCWTGFGYAETAQLTPENVEETPSGLVIGNRRKKTDKALFSPICSLFKEPGAKQSKPERLVSRLLQRHKERFPDPEDYYQTPIFTNSKKTGVIRVQVVDRRLKQIAAAAGIRKNLTSHAGRRSFAQRLDSKGLTLPDIRELMGHSTITMTTLYIQANPDGLIRKLEKVSW